MNNNKVPYEVPEVEIVELKVEGVVCVSSTNPFGDSTEETWIN